MNKIFQYICFAVLFLIFSASCGNEFSILLDNKGAVNYGTCTLYYVEYGSGTNDGRIIRSRSDGTETVVLLSSLTGPYDCAVDTVSGYMFWVEDHGAGDGLVKKIPD